MLITYQKFGKEIDEVAAVYHLVALYMEGITATAQGSLELTLSNEFLAAGC